MIYNNDFKNLSKVPSIDVQCTGPLSASEIGRYFLKKRSFIQQQITLYVEIFLIEIPLTSQLTEIKLLLGQSTQNGFTYKSPIFLIVFVHVDGDSTRPLLCVFLRILLPPLMHLTFMVIFTRQSILPVLETALISRRYDTLDVGSFNGLSNI